MRDDFERKILVYRSLASGEQDRLRLAAEQRARRLKKEATAGFFRALSRGAGSVFRFRLYRNNSGRTSATSISRP
jgi:hypothetical protein